MCSVIKEKHSSLSLSLTTFAPGFLIHQVMGKYTYKPQFGVIVICADEREQKAVYDRLQSEGLTLKIVNV